MGQIDWTYRTYAIPAGTNTLRWQYVKDAQYNSGNDRAWLDQVTWVTAPPMHLQQALDTCGVLWTSGGNTNPTYWAGQTNTAYDGKSAAQSGAIYTSQETWMQTVVSGITNVSFWWKVSSQTNYDFLEFYTNGALARRISGEVNWQSNYYKLPVITNTLKWRFVKTNFNILPPGQNCGWVDRVLLDPPPKAFPYALGAPTVLPEGAVQLSVSGEAGCRCQLQVSTTLSNWNLLSNFTTTSTSTQITDSTAPNSPFRFYRALSP